MNFLAIAFALIGLYLGLLVSFYALGYLWERGRNAATKHRKVCDSCFRDIERWNKAYAEAKSNKGDE